MSPADEISSVIPARRGKAIRLAAKQAIKIINTPGSQVVDSWIFNAMDPTEFMSMEHMRAVNGNIMPRPGDGLISNKRRALAIFETDTSPGIHDTLIAACDTYRYQQLGCTGHHDNCTENLQAALAALGLRATETPAPLNLWMNIPVGSDHDINWLPPVSAAGDYVVLRAAIDCIVVLSACPQDMVPINGADMVPKDVHYLLLPEKTAGSQQ